MMRMRGAHRCSSAQAGSTADHGSGSPLRETARREWYAWFYAARLT